MRNLLFVLSGPSGVGKGTIAKILDEKGSVALSISCTTRLPRNGEINGVHYFFTEKEEFLKKINNGDFLEYSEHFGNYYGTLREFVTEKLKEKDVLLEIDVNGALAVKKAYPEAVLIMVTPPSIEELKNRLIGRGTESLEKIEERIQRVEYELNKQSEYDHVVINDSLFKAVSDIENIMLNEKLKKEI